MKTVSRVVNREPNVREATKAIVEAAIAELNYRPNPSARNLASHRAHIIGLIYDDPSAYEVPSAGYVVNMQQGALSSCRNSHYELLIHPCDYRKRNIDREIEEIIEYARPAGIILAAPLSDMPRIVRAIEATNTPMIRLSPGRPKPNERCVVTNDREISAEMTEYLASLGHEKIAFITGHPSHKAVTNRFAGFKDGMRRSGLKVSEQLVVSGDNSFGSGEIAAEQLLRRKQRPTAIFAANDDMAAGVIRVANRFGIEVPTELSIAGFDDIALARLVFPNLTTIQQPLTAMAERAAFILIEGAANGTNGTEVVPASIVIRESTGPVPANQGSPE
jgi:LacI family transcriptional regulator